MVSDIDLLDKYKITYASIKGKLRESRKDQVLKTIAAYLINRATDDAEGVHLSIVDILNWCTMAKDGGSSYKIDDYSYDGKPLFIDIPYLDNVKLIRIPEEIIEHYRLVDADRIAEEIKIEDDKSQFVYIDEGKKPLKKIEIKTEKTLAQLSEKLKKENNKLRAKV